VHIQHKKLFEPLLVLLSFEKETKNENDDPIPSVFPPQKDSVWLQASTPLGQIF
jgi:hypothetical protein